MNGYNPMIDYQRNQLLAQQAMIQQQLNQVNQQQFIQTNQPQFVPGRGQKLPEQIVAQQVDGIEEAKRINAEPGVTYLFPDTSTGLIYMRRMNTENGRTETYTFRLEEGQPLQTDPIDQINERLSNIEKSLGVLYDKSVSKNGANATGNEEPDGGNLSKLHKSADEANAGEKPAAVPKGAGDDQRQKRQAAHGDS